MSDKDYLNTSIENGKEKAIYVANSVLNEVYEVVGFSKAKKSPTS